MRRAARTMAARPRELFAALALVALADVAVWKGALGYGFGYGFALFFLAVPALVIGAAHVRRFSLRLAAIGAMLSVVALRCFYEPTIGTVVAGLAGIFAMALVVRDPSAWFASGFWSFLATALTPARRVGSFGVGLRRSLGGGRAIAGIVLPILLVALFGGLFALANPVVGHGVQSVSEHLVVPKPARIAMWGGLLLGAFLLLRPAIQRKRIETYVEPDEDATDYAISVSRNALIAVNVLFLAYNALDARYLWAGSPPAGMSERTYAHQGAAWLTVTLIVLTGIVGFMFRGALTWDERAKATRYLAFGWLAQGGILALGTYRRMMIHVDTSGLSSLRILGMFGTSVVVLGLVTVGVKLAQRRTFGWLVDRQVDVFMAATFLFSILPTHWIGAHANIAPVMKHEFQPLVHVEEQAREAESAVALLPLVHHDDERIRKGMAALLLDELDTLETRRVLRPIQGRNYAEKRALAELGAVRPELETVLGDVDRKDAIRQFEYIRNSSIEGEIALSEINRVEKPRTRSEKAVEEWASTNGISIDTPPKVSVDGTHAVSTIDDVRFARTRHITLHLERYPTSAWAVTKVEGLD